MKKNFTLIVLFALFATTKTNIINAQVNVQDSLALVDLYDSTGGPNWTHHDNWLTSTPVSTWYGVEVTNNRVTYLGFYTAYKSAPNNMIGRLPNSINNLTELTGLILSYNQLTGNIPILKKVQELYLNNNQLSGTLPDTICNPLNSYTIFLDHNNFSGNVPYSYANYNIASTIELEYNHLTGFSPFPDSFNVSHYEVSIDLSYNNLNGLVPFKAIANYRELFLEHNQLTGIAPFPGNYNTSSIMLSQLDVSYNTLTGIIPYYIMSLPNIYELNLSYNQLSGQIRRSVKIFLPQC